MYNGYKQHTLVHIECVYVYLSVATETHHTNNNGDIFDNMANSE